MSHSETIAIIGAGNMGASLLGGLIANHYAKDQLWISDTDTQKLNVLKNQFHINITEDNREALQVADVVILAIKPQVLLSVVKDLADLISHRKPLLISIAAGIRVDSIQKAVGQEIAIVRAMPNTPALIGCGATALFANTHTSAAQKELAESLMRAVSLVVWVTKENLMDNITALSGSGPAYFFLMMEALQNAAIESGLSPDTARILTLQTAYGAARMALESEIDLKELRNRVTSPGGTTEAALKVMQLHQLPEIYKKAFSAAQLRSEELANLLDSEQN
jgi:pyrroline-5-carboxylate reductase